MLLTQALSLLGFACYPSALTIIQAEWSLSNFESGFLASSFFLGYVLVVPIATTLTDRIDTRQVYLAGGLTAGLGLLGVGFLANGFYSALFFLMIHGAGVSAMYMPGLKIISEIEIKPIQISSGCWRFVFLVLVFFALICQF
jgi:MFS family permease